MDDLIDYTGDSVDESPSHWTHSSFKKYFIESYHKIHKAGGAVPWTIKEQALLSRMCEEYEKEDLANMILYWHTSTHRPAIASRFVNFYSTRVDIYHKMKKATSDYSWD